MMSLGKAGEVGDHRLRPGETPCRPNLGISVLFYKH